MTIAGKKQQGYVRRGYGKFLKRYSKKGIFPSNSERSIELTKLWIRAKKVHPIKKL